MTIVHVAVVQLSIFCWCYQNDDDHNILRGDDGDAPRDHKDEDANLVPRKAQPVQQLDQLTSEIFNHSLQDYFFQLMGLRGYLLLALLNLRNICRFELKLGLKLKSFGKDFQLVSVMVWIEHVLWFFLEIVLFSKDG